MHITIIEAEKEGSFMKKNAYTVFALLGAMLLTSCGGNDPSKERIIIKDVYTIGADLVNIEDGVKADIDLARVMTIDRKMVVDKLTGKI